ncbi:MAG: hypothetical protein HUU20_03690 [Pirellulales bacterium]|nr:hypothetical protein [Pirellulales bacterium]
MALKKRERNLAIVTAVLVVLFLGKMFLSTWGRSGGPREAQRNELTREIERKKRQIERGRQAAARLAQWQRQSLPKDREAARSVYQNWLLASANSVGFDGTKVETTIGRQRGETYYALRFNLQAQATLEEVTQFLYRFYSAGYLHQILNLDLLPSDNGRKLDVQLSVEALSLPQSDRTDKLPEKPSKPLLTVSASDYAKAVAGRNIFAPFRKPDPPPAEPPKFDAAKYVYLTAVVQVGEQPQAWIVNRTSGDCLKLREGDEFRAGDFRGKVQRIGRREAEIEVDGQRWLLPLGDNLREAVKVSGKST